MSQGTCPPSLSSATPLFSELELTTALFEQHGMTNIGYWIPNERPNTLIYLLAHDRPEAAAHSWQGFRQDADWQRAYQASREDGPLVANVESIFLTATNYSDLK